MFPLEVTRSRRAYENPFDLLDREFGRLIGRVRQDAEDNGGGGAWASYPIDIREDSEHVYVDAELPGFSKDQVDVTLENGVLSIRAQRDQQPTQEGQVQHVQERRFTRVQRSFTVPKTVDENQVDAKLEDGVLHLTLNKREEVKPRRITVQ